MNDILIIGTGGFAKEIKSLIDKINSVEKVWNILGFVDDWGKCKGEHIFEGINVWGSIDDLNNYGEKISVTIAIGNPFWIKEAVGKVNNQFVSYPNLIHPNVEMHSTVKIGKGNVITFGNFVSCDVRIGDYNIFNIKCALGHDVIIGSYNLFNPNVQISGSVKIGDCNFWGVNSLILQGKIVGNDNKIGASTLVVKSIKNNSFYFGVPGKKHELI